jgi:hypothetical protein
MKSEAQAYQIIRHDLKRKMNSSQRMQCFYAKLSSAFTNDGDLVSAQRAIINAYKHRDIVSDTIRYLNKYKVQQ